MIRVYEKNAIPCTIQQIRHFTFPWFNLNRDGIVGYFGKLLANCIFLNVLNWKDQLSHPRPCSSNSHLAFILMLTDSLWTLPKGQRNACLSHVCLSIDYDIWYISLIPLIKVKDQSGLRTAHPNHSEKTLIFSKKHLNPLKKMANAKWSYINNMSVKWHGTSWKLLPLIGNNHNLSYIISPVHQGLHIQEIKLLWKMTAGLQG